MFAKADNENNKSDSSAQSDEQLFLKAMAGRVLTTLH